MEILQAIVMGVVQGVTEFLPISSSAHLRITPALLGWPDFGAAFTAVIQLGTLVAVLVYFRTDLLAITRAMVGAISDPARRSSKEARLALGLVVATLPVGIVGLTLKKHIEGPFRSLWVVVATMVGVAIVIEIAERISRGTRVLADTTLKDAVLVGCAQACAVVPGVSRSGATLAAALLLGLRRDEGARFSFLMSIPAIGAAGLFELKHALRPARDVAEAAATAHPATPVMIVIASLVSLVVGYASIAWLIGYLKRHSMSVFVVYRLLLGGTLAGLLLAGILQPR